MSPTPKSEHLQKRLAAEGLTPDQISSYLDTLSSFLMAKLTKIQFEDAMAKVLPREKYSVHNAIILEILHRALKPQEGLPNVPVIQPVKDKQKQSSHSKLPSIPKPANNKKPPPPKKHPRPDPPEKERPAKKIKPSPPDEETALGIPPAEIPTYDMLSFQPVPPGLAIDMELFLKVRRRMAHKVQKMGIPAGVKDEAAGLLTHALEIHLKNVLEACVRSRVDREHGVRPQRFRPVNAIASVDLKEGMLRDVHKLGNDPSEVLERLSMLV